MNKNLIKAIIIDFFVWIWAFAFFALSKTVDNFVLECLINTIGIIPCNYYIWDNLSKRYKI